MLDSQQKVCYPLKKAMELATMLQKNDPEWVYVVRENETNSIAVIEVLDSDGYFMGYM